MKQVLRSNVREDVAWQGLKLEKGQMIYKYMDKFWDLHLKATTFENNEFQEQRQ